MEIPPLPSTIQLITKNLEYLQLKCFIPNPIHLSATIQSYKVNQRSTDPSIRLL